MKCNLEWLSAYLDGALAEEKRAKLEKHLKTCEACTAKLEEFARVEQAAKKIPAPQLSEAYWENFASRVQNKLTIREKQKTSPGWLEALKGFFQPTTGKLAIAGSVAVIILLTF
ncbi:MAG: zf-HC2 domain-containing protein, partial [candidate division Zixibacteria bacterium]|nr:zf-HC2 domain-containing protein [candidate division Zixibacteria bacterium]